MADWNLISRPWRAVPLIAIAGAVALLIGGLVAGLYGERLYRAQKIREVTVQADILASTVTAAVAFDDVAAAQDYANALAANPEIEAAGIYDEDGRLVAGYQKAGAALPSRLSRLEAPHFQDGHLIVPAAVVEGANRVGAVELRAVTEPVARRFSRYVLVAVMLGMGALLLGVLGAAHAVLTRANRELRHRAQDLAEANEALRVQIEEREKAEEALRQSQKMEAIGQLTGGVAHDFNNLLMVASSGMDLLDRTEDPARRERLKDGVRQALDRGAGLTRQLLAFSRRAALNPEVVEPAGQIEGLQLLLDRSLREDITVAFELAPGLWPVEIDTSQFELALLNVAVNARDAMPSGGRIVIAAENVEGLDDGTLKGDFVRLSVRDTGKGMEPDTISRVFEPFFTTKDRGQGTGLGLSQVYGFSRASGGDVRIDSQIGAGTTISLYLPRSKKPLSQRGEAQPAASKAPRGRGRVLLVEDDPAVAELVGEMLVELGYEPRRVGDAAQALVALQVGPSVDLVFSDMVMPGQMDGIELAREIGRIHPELPVVLTTGYSEAAAAANHDGVRLLLKPYRIEALAAELEAALAERRVRRKPRRRR